MIILAQTAVNVHSDTPAGVWIALATMIVGALGFRFDAWVKSKKEQEERIKDRELDVDKQKTLYRIASATEDNEKANITRHFSLMLALKDSCKAECRNFEPVKPKKEKEIDK